MNTTDEPYEAYVYAVREQLEQHLPLLEEISQLISERPLTRIERSGTERCLQLIVEVALGCSKHYLKSQGLPVPSESAAAIHQVYAVLAIQEPAENEMIGAVGMRNVIVNDYLNLDWSKVTSVLVERKYRHIGQYCTMLLDELLSVNKHGG